MGKRTGLARRCPGDDQERMVIVCRRGANAVLDGTALVGIELFKIGREHNGHNGQITWLEKLLGLS